MASTLKGWFNLRFKIQGDEASIEIGWFWIALVAVLILTSCQSKQDRQWHDLQYILEQTQPTER